MSDRIWYVCRDGKLWQECFSRREARYWVTILRKRHPASVWGVESD
jgi:hypothetical protein